VYGWRAAFFVSGALGILWLPLWFWISANAPALEQRQPEAKISAASILRDRRLITLVIANILAMTVYSLWTNWTTVFLVSAHGITREEANLQFAWIPPIFATAGGLLGGWLANRMIRAGKDVLKARIRIAAIAGACALTTGLASIAPGAGLATAAICISNAAILCLSVNYYALPLDMFGAGRAAFAVSLLTGVYGLMQTVISPIIARWSEDYGWQPVCMGVSALPLLSVALLKTAFRQP
jgi:ACS family hexuronate transporter-like MFS transporter